MSALGANRTRRDGGNDVNGPEASTGNWLAADFLSSDPYSDTAHIAMPGYGTLAFAECGRITEIWSKVDAAGRRQHLPGAPAGALSGR